MDPFTALFFSVLSQLMMYLLCRKLNHPHIVRYLGIHRDASGKLYIVTEFLAKGSLSDVIAAESKELTAADLLRM